MSNIIKKLDMFIGEEGIVTGDVEANTAKGSIDVVGEECKKGYKWCPKEKACIPITNEDTKVEELKNVKNK